MNRLDNKVALITGGARGLGGAMAHKMAAAGAKVLITDLLEEAGAETAEAIQNEGGTAIFMRHDVTDEGQWAAAIALAVDKLGGLDILVNNAGIASDGTPLEHLSLEAWRKVIAVDLDSLFLGIKHAIPPMRERAGQWAGGGSIINISSIYGIVGSPGAASYHAAKGGVRLLTKAAALELAPAKIRVNSVHPGFIETDMVREGIRKMAGAGLGIGENEMKQELTNRHPIGRMGVPVDIANAVLFLASDDSAFMTGTEVVVDGGYTAQ